MKNVVAKNVCTAVIVASGIATNPVIAKESYWGLDLGLYEIDVGAEFDVKQLQVTYGQQTDWKLIGDKPLTLEYRGSLGVDDDGVKLNYHLGAYLRQEFSVSGNIRPYGLLGLAHAKASADRLGSDTETGLSYGLGVQYELSNGYILNFEYVLEFVDDVDGFSFGIRF